jgi:chemotaxis protein methyltransferase CheR
LLREVLPEREPSILAIDVNPAMIERARAGLFSRWSLRDTAPACVERWFERKGDAFLIDQQIRRSVNFREGNLMLDDPAIFAADNYDVIFCCNVLMYFGLENRKEVMKRLARSLAPGGYLFLGSAETLRDTSHDFQLCNTQQAFYYREKTRASPSLLRVGVREQGPVAPLERGAASWVDDIERAANRIIALTDAPSVEQVFKRAASARVARARPRWDLSIPLALLQEEQFAEALRCVRGLPAEAAQHPDKLLLEAVLLASDGQLAEAERACERLLARDELSAGAHYVLALCDSGAGRLDAAAYHDRLATYLAPEFAMPRLHLGLLLRRGGDLPAALHELTQARSLLEREDIARLSMFGGGFGRGALLALCAAEIAAAAGGA